MDEMQIRTLEDIEQFLAEPMGAQLKLQGSKDDVYKWIEHTLVRFRYPWLGKVQKGVLLRYIRQLSGYTRQHVTKLVKQQRKTGYIKRKPRAANSFATTYTRADIRLLVDVDRVVDDLSGTSIKTFCQRAFEIHRDQLRIPVNATPDSGRTRHPIPVEADTLMVACC